MVIGIRKLFMPKKKYLVFLTKQFPYGTGEQYITSELHYLSEIYERIFVYPSDCYLQDPKTKIELPTNVEIIHLNQVSPPRVKKIKFLQTFFRAACYEFLYTHSKSWFLKKINHIFHVYLSQYAQGLALEKFAKERGLLNENTTYYSYWFSMSALCLSILKDRKQINNFYSKAHALDLYHEKWASRSNPSHTHPYPPYLKNYKLKHISELFPISEHGGNFLQQSYSKLKTSVRYLGVDDSGLNPNDNVLGEFVISTCSSLTPRKRVPSLGEALSSLNRPVRWVHFGGGPDEKKLFESVTSENVKLDYNGETPNIEIRNFYSSHHIDLFVNLSTAEGLPVAIMEALSHGIPVLATAVYGTPEAVVEDVSGKLIPVDFSQELLIKEIVNLMDNPEKLSEMRLGARRMFEEKFNAQKNHIEFARYLISQP